MWRGVFLVWKTQTLRRARWYAGNLMHLHGVLEDRSAFCFAQLIKLLFYAGFETVGSRWFLQKKRGRMWIVMLYNKLYCAKNKKGVRSVQSAELHFIPRVLFEGLLYVTFELLGGKKKSLFSLLNDRKWNAKMWKC